MNGLSVILLFRCFLRTYFVLAAYNPRGLQNIGFLHAIEPGLEALHGQGKALRNARMRYARHYNCHPFFTPMLLGVFLRMEAAIAAGRLSPQILLSLKDTTANALSGIGDSFFNGTLLSTWALGTLILLCTGHPTAAAGMTLVLFVLLQLFKLGTFIMGCRRGMACLHVIRRLDLINWSERLKCCNAALLVLFLWLALPVAPPVFWGGVGLYLFAGVWFVGKLHMPRVIVALVVIVLILSLSVVGVLEGLPGFFAAHFSHE